MEGGSKAVNSNRSLRRLRFVVFPQPKDSETNVAHNVLNHNSAHATISYVYIYNGEKIEF